MKEQYDSSWNLVRSQKGNLPKNRRTYDEKYQEWVKRDWMMWLKENLAFPFVAKRTDDEDDAYFTDVAKRDPFRLGHTMNVIGLEGQQGRNGIMVKVREGRRIGYVPLFDLEVTPKDDPNFWPVREYNTFLNSDHWLRCKNRLYLAQPGGQDEEAKDLPEGTQGSRSI